MFNRLLVVSLLASLTLIQPTMAAADTEDSGIDRNPVYHVYADVDLIPTTKLMYDKPRIVIKAIVPQLKSETEDEYIDEFNETVNDFVQEEADNFIAKVKELSEVQKQYARSSLRNNLDIDFDTAVIDTGDNPLISIRYAINGYATGLSRPTRIHRVMNYDLEAGTEIELSDLFLPNTDYLRVIADYSRQMLSRKLKSVQHDVEAGTTPTEEHYQLWNVTPHALRFTFDEGQVAPALYGTQTVSVPFSLLKDMIAPDSVLGICMNHPKRCANEHLLTGGFMDQAINTKHRRFNPVLS